MYVNAFTPNVPVMQIPIVNVAVMYGLPYDGNQYMLAIQNALFVKLMRNNLIPRFIWMTPPPMMKLQIPLQQLEGTFSYFPASCLTVQLLNESGNAYLLTPPTFNPIRLGGRIGGEATSHKDFTLGSRRISHDDGVNASLGC